MVTYILHRHSIFCTKFGVTITLFSVPHTHSFYHYHTGKPVGWGEGRGGGREGEGGGEGGEEGEGGG